MHSVSVLLATAALAVVSATPMGNVTTVTQIRALADDGSQWTLEDGKDYQGYDLTNMRGANANACTASCVATAGCRAFTWTDWQGGTCWLKTARGNVVAHSGATSGVLTPVGPSNQCELTQGVDIVGNDAGSMLASDASLCCAQCSRKPGCAAYTWTSYNGGMCWFKSAVGELKPNAGAVTGRVTGSRADHIQYSIRSGAIPSRSVNLGGWLVSEYWMSKTSPAWQDVDYDTAMSGEYITMQKIGKDKGTRQFEAHRASWITEQDIREIRDVGLNMVRVPVGFWIVDEIQGVEPTAISSVYARGSLKYLDKLINDWAVKYNVAVMLSLHSHQGSQNGNDHSAPQKLWSVDWSKTPDNYANSVRFATTLAARYKDAPAFLGIGLMNEPTNVDFEMAKRYYLEAYDKIRATGNDCILAVAPQLWAQSKESLPDFMRWPQYTNVWMEWHVYYKWGYENQNEYQILDAVRHFRDSHFDGWPGNYVFMGEWSLGNPDEKLFKDRGLMKQFASLQLQQYSEAHAGWAFWSWHHDDEKLPGTISGWSLRQLLREGIMTVPK